MGPNCIVVKPDYLPTKAKWDAKCSKTRKATKARPMMSMSSYMGKNKHEKKKSIK
jgi:hypothetical protein